MTRPDRCPFIISRVTALSSYIMLEPSEALSSTLREVFVKRNAGPQKIWKGEVSIQANLSLENRDKGVEKRNPYERAFH